MKRCSVEGCDRPFRCSGYCGLHYSRLRKLGTPGSAKALTTKADRRGARPKTDLGAWCYGCEKMLPWAEFGPRRAYCKGCAREMYQRKPCPDCNKSIDIRAGRCQPCWGLSKRGKPTKTGRYITQGYAMLTGKYGHPNARKNGHIAEHVMVMAEKIGRPLVKGENVHHVNGVRDDNRPENLELWVVSQPSGQRPADLVAWAHEILERYDQPERMSTVRGV